MSFLNNNWPWYISGIAIGLFVPCLFILRGKAFGVSASLRHICAVFPLTKIKYFGYNWKREGAWNLYFAIGIVVGGWIASYIFTDADVIDISEKTKQSLTAIGITQFDGLVPQQIFNWNYLRTIPGFIQLAVGGFLIGFGTRYADGCTSGHAISGLSNLQLSSLIAVIGFFSGGLVATHVLLPLVLN
ncbi:TPA: YeeE/YedE family protein [Candidatus Poribacteria bacterium]|nr:YeeE/YedE family protein [Candidatus Poribacteria bacterium]